jgi:ABC-type glycerol-3-phosphate transport system permease component
MSVTAKKPALTADVGHIQVTVAWSRLYAQTPLYLVVLVGAVIFAFPLVWLVGTSLKPESDVFLFPPNLIPRQLVWVNYPDALVLFPFVQGFLNTMIIVTGVEVGRLLSATLAAFAFARVRFPYRNVLFVLVLSTMLLPYHVTLIPQFLIFRDIGWLNSFLPLTVPAFFGGGAFYIFLLRQFFLGIPKEYDDAAEIDGCTPLGTYWRIILPLSKPALGAVAIFTFIGEWNDYFGPLIYLNRPENYTLALSFKIWELTQQSGLGYKPQPYNRIMAVATLITLIPMVVFFLTQRYFIQGVVVSGLKG